MASASIRLSVSDDSQGEKEKDANAQLMELDKGELSANFVL